jgi:hypothetical protein
MDGEMEQEANRTIVYDAEENSYLIVNLKIFGFNQTDKRSSKLLPEINGLNLDSQKIFGTLGSCGIVSEQ